MAFVKKPLQGGVKEFLEDYSVDLENRIGDIGKADIGLGSVIDERQLFTELKGSSNSSWSHTLKNDTKYLLTSD